MNSRQIGISGKSMDTQLRTHRPAWLTLAALSPDLVGGDGEVEGAGRLPPLQRQLQPHRVDPGLGAPLPTQARVCVIVMWTVAHLVVTPDDAGWSIVFSGQGYVGVHIMCLHTTATMSMTMIPFMAITMSTMSIAIMTIVTMLGLLHLLIDGHPYGRVSRRQKLEKYDRDTDCEVISIMVIFWGKKYLIKKQTMVQYIDSPYLRSIQKLFWMWSHYNFLSFHNTY